MARFRAGSVGQAAEEGAAARRRVRVRVRVRSVGLFMGGAFGEKGAPGAKLGRRLELG